MVKPMLRPGDGERRGDTRFELVAWATIRRGGGEPAGKVLVTDVSRGGFNMQSRWDFVIGERVQIEVTPSLVLDATVAWHDAVVGAYGCRFAQMLTRKAFEDILSKADSVPDMPEPKTFDDERRVEQRVKLHVPIIARRAGMIDCEVAILTTLSVSGFRMRSASQYDIDQTIYAELGPTILAEARVLRHRAESGEYAASFRFGLSSLLIDRLIAASPDA